jgi:prophage maintenance system killer protein
VRYLTAQDLIDLHRAVSADFGGTQAKAGEIDSQYGLTSAVIRPQATVFGKDAYPTIGEKAAALVFALIRNSPFRGGNRRVAAAALFAFAEMNGKTVDPKVLDEKALETLFKRAGQPEGTIAPENAFHDLCDTLKRAIV